MPAAAIAAAFNAPLTGAFYGFELIIGTYTLGTFAPVAVAAIVAVSVQHALGPPPFDLTLVMPPLQPQDYVPILALGVFCALISIAIMRGVTLTEELFRKSRVPPWLRPAVGGVIVGLFSLVTPMVLSSGHGAIGLVITAPLAVWWLGLLVLMKACASAISIGSGFRGGLFFASLFLGALIGQVLRQRTGADEHHAYRAASHHGGGGHELDRRSDYRRTADDGLPGAWSPPATCR